MASSAMPLTFDVARMLHLAQLPLPHLGLAPRPRSCKRCARGGVHAT